MGMGLREKFMGIDVVMTNQSQQCCPVTLPVALSKMAGLLLGKTEPIGHKGRHSAIDLTHDPPGGVVQGVIEIDQP